VRRDHPNCHDPVVFAVAHDDQHSVSANAIVIMVLEHLPVSRIVAFHDLEPAIRVRRPGTVVDTAVDEVCITIASKHNDQPLADYTAIHHCNIVLVNAS